MNRDHNFPYQRKPTFQTPRADNTSLLTPDVRQASDLLLANESRFASNNDRPVANTTFGELRLAVQHRLLQLARDWYRHTLHSSVKHRGICACTARQESMLSRIEEWMVNTSGNVAPIILGGHQPELFHNGVWFKNAVISNIANEERGIAINLIIDHDLPKHVAINVPTLAEDNAVGLRTVSPLRLNANVPWEMLDGFASVNTKFDLEVSDLSADLLSYEPMLGEYWKYLQESVALGFKLGHAVAISRHRIEQDHGWNTLELPFSQLCDSPEFGKFVSEVVAHAHEMRDAYNAARDAYRKDHRIRNEAHPVPALSHSEVDGAKWCEVPFWIYSDEIPNRRALWLCCEEGQYWLSDRSESGKRIELGGSPTISTECWSAIVARGIRIRPRALMTTTFLRLFASDLFVHGIGGGKYDQVTDQIIRDFWKMKPPEFLVASASLHLPMFAKSTNLSSKSENELQQRIRETRFHPERILLGRTSKLTNDIERLIHQKLKLIQNVPLKETIEVQTSHRQSNETDAYENKTAWHHELEEVNQALSEYLAEHRTRLQHQLDELRFNQRQKRLLESREYSFLLFSKRNSLHRLDELLPEVSNKISAQSEAT